MSEKEKIVLTPELLETFKQKTSFSVGILPACWGGYDKDDSLCQNCLAAKTSSQPLVIHKTGERINEEGGYLTIREYNARFFAEHPTSCKNRRWFLQAAMHELEQANSRREERYVLQGLTRMPKDNIHPEKYIINYVSHYKAGIRVRLGDESEKFPEAIGAVYRFLMADQFDPHSPFRPDLIVGYVKCCTPEFCNPLSIHLHIKDQDINESGNLVLFTQRIINTENYGLNFMVEIFGDSAVKATANFDDIGRLDTTPILPL